MTALDLFGRFLVWVLGLERLPPVGHYAADCPCTVCCSIRRKRRKA